MLKGGELSCPPCFEVLNNYFRQCAVAKFLVPDRRDIVDSGTGLSYRSAIQGWLAGTTSLCRSRYIPQSGTKNLASVFKRQSPVKNVRTDNMLQNAKFKTKKKHGLKSFFINQGIESSTGAYLQINVTKINLKVQ